MVRSTHRLLVVDDEPNMCRSLKILLEEEGHYEVRTALTGEQGLAIANKGTDLVITDLSMPGMDGIELLRAIKKHDSDTQVIIMTAYSTVKSAIEAMKAGAFEYLIKPFENDELLVVVENALKLCHLSQQNRDLKDQLKHHYSLGNLVGKSVAMKDIFFLIHRASETDTTVLITGESGTGKELVARCIHYMGSRQDQPFVAINCSALPESLLESELFGHEKGAFTGAIRTKIGLFERAHTGTLFLDEVGEMSLHLQTKLLRVLQDRTFQRVGGVDPIAVDIRIMAATNKNLAKAIQEGVFREDLYYRLNVIPIVLPPLRHRPEDIPLLVDHVLEAKKQELKKPDIELSDEARALLCEYDYPGNVRELENILERSIVIVRNGIIKSEDLPIHHRESTRIILENYLPDLNGGWTKLQEISKDLERQLVERAVQLYKGRSNEEIATIIGTSRRVLELRLQEFGLTKQKEL